MLRASNGEDKKIRTAEMSLDNRQNWRISDYILSALEQCTPSAIASLSVTEEAREMLTPLTPMLHTAPSGEVFFEMGQPTTPRHQTGKRQSKSQEDDSQTEIPYSSLLDSYRVFEHSEICADLDFEDLVSFDFNDDRHRGIFLHAVLSRVRHRSDLGRALDTMAYRYRLTPVQKQQCLLQLSEALDDERVQPWFEGFRRVLNERTLTAVFERRRPDRVVWLADGSVAVVDYKFGQQHRPEYREQVSDYVNLLSFAGYPGARGFLWYPLEGTITRVV